MITKKKKTKKKKERDNWLEAQVLAILEKSMTKALNKALDDIFKGW